MEYGTEGIKKMLSISFFMKTIKEWYPENCPRRLCKRYLENIGFIETKHLYMGDIWYGQTSSIEPSVDYFGGKLRIGWVSKYAHVTYI